MSTVDELRSASEVPTRGSSQSDTTTIDVIRPLLEQSLKPSLVDAWVKALHAAEVLHRCLHPAYVGHSERELDSYARAALLGHRDASRLVADLLATG